MNTSITPRPSVENNFRFSSVFGRRAASGAAATLKLPRERCPECGLWFRATHIARHVAMTHAPTEPDRFSSGRCACGRSISRDAERCYRCEDRDKRMLELDMITRVRK